MFRGGNFRNREVININNAQRLGYVSDIEIDAACGNIKAIIVKRRGHILGAEMMIPWENICVMGDEIVLVSLLEFIDDKK